MWIFSQRSSSSTRGRPRKAGFTLIELLLVSAIMLIITSLLLLRQSKFDSSTILRSLAYSLSLSVRQAQVYGNSVLGTATSQANCTGFYNTTTGACYASAYGLYLTPGTSYSLFSDLNQNGTHDTGEEVNTYLISQGYKISEICAIGSLKDCSGTDNTGTAISQLSIVFKRPNPDACITTDTHPTVCASGASPIYSSAYIQVSSADGTTRSVIVSSTGEIAVQAPNTGP